MNVMFSQHPPLSLPHSVWNPQTIRILNKDSKDIASVISGCFLATNIKKNDNMISNN